MTSKFDHSCSLMIKNQLQSLHRPIKDLSQHFSKTKVKARVLTEADSPMCSLQATMDALYRTRLNQMSKSRWNMWLSKEIKKTRLWSTRLKSNRLLKRSPNPASFLQFQNLRKLNNRMKKSLLKKSKRLTTRQLKWRPLLTLWFYSQRSLKAAISYRL